MLLVFAVIGVGDVLKNTAVFSVPGVSKNITKQPPPPLFPAGTVMRKCPIVFNSELASALRAEPKASRVPDQWWLVASADGGRPPWVVVVMRSATAPAGSAGSCELTIKTTPDRDANVDWRLGHHVGGVRSLRGRSIRFTVKMKASDVIRFNSASIYVYDGVGMTDVPITVVGKDWQELSAVRVIHRKASVFEVWIRLVYGNGTIHWMGQSRSPSLYVTSQVSLE